MNPLDVIHPDFLHSLTANQKLGPLEVEIATFRDWHLKLRQEVLIEHSAFGKKKFEITKIEYDLNNGKVKYTASRILDKKS